jgi:hypothetical protein
MSGAAGRHATVVEEPGNFEWRHRHTVLYGAQKYE